MAIRKTFVCVIDDDPLVCGAFEYALRDHGFAVVVAHDCATGLKAALDCDVVLTDLNIGAGDGLELISALRRGRPQLLIIAMTGGALRGGVDIASRAVAGGANLCLLKPFKPSELLRALSTACVAEAV